MKKVLYMCHIDWDWIKQRPQFIAEGLSKHFNVSVVYMHQNRNRKVLQKQTNNKIIAKPLYRIPFSSRFKWSNVINNWFMARQFFNQYKKFDPDYIYLTYPDQINLIPKKFSGKVIYDCMDNHVAMAHEQKKDLIKTYEGILVDVSDYVLVSSQNLLDIITERYSIANIEKFSVIRNGYSGKILNSPPIKSTSEEGFTFSYIGTVSHWFNFDFILKSLDDFDNIKYKIIGPIEAGFKVPSHERIQFVGTVEHHKLYDAIKNTSCLIMPFQVNDIIKSVDPVKLYEYINYNMNILCVKYDEVLRFKKFVEFYSDYESFKSKIENLIKTPNVKYSQDDRLNFLKTSDWDSRVNEIIKIIEND